MVTFQICTRYILVYSLHEHIQLGGGGGYCIGIDIIQMHFHLYLQPNKMGLTKLKLASHRRCTYSKKRTLTGLQRTTPAKHIKSFHMSSQAKRQPTPHSSIKKSSTAARKQTPKRTRKQLFGGFTDDNVEVPLSYSPKTCKSHDDSSANTEPDQSNIDPNYKEVQDLLASNGLADFLPKLHQALVNG